ncbi:hypothetical protein LPC08_04310 [Roseomonas sp. OT10]|uniref:hypothetical protein n=1 Tax=Roseomonas cutis TaxID=2897332 RepID=UPI001E4947F4|nr:hypothetical protein [Roseomonas sp. OT10]UFN49873.1 hypothetical protein LPC08_04310 [Roseomonas sp. OT10]
MPVAEPGVDAAAVRDFLDLVGRPLWNRRLRDLGQAITPRTLGARAAQQRHMAELALARLGTPGALAGATAAERRFVALAQEAVTLARALPRPAGERLRERLAAGLTGPACLMPLLHLLRVAALQRARGFTVHHAGLIDGASYDLLCTREGEALEIACETVSAEDGRHMPRTDWCALVDRVNPDLHTWLSAHPGRYVLKVTLPEGLREAQQVAELHRRIMALLAAQRRQDADQAAILKLDPLLVAGAQAALPGSLRAQFGPEAHLAVAGDPSGGSVFVIAARSGRENDISAAVCRRLAAAAAGRLSGTRPALLAIFLDDLERGEWRGLRERLELEGAVRRFLTRPEARPLVAVSCASRAEMLDLPVPDAAPDGELRFRNPSHPQARLPALLPAIASSV